MVYRSDGSVVLRPAHCRASLSQPYYSRCMNALERGDPDVRAAAGLPPRKEEFRPTRLIAKGADLVTQPFVKYQE